jgi:hypothetical protein
LRKHWIDYKTRPVGLRTIMLRQIVALVLVASLGAASLPRGVLDVTSPPYNADPTGARDSTAALQAAIDAAFNQSLAAFFPPGRYIVNDTLIASQANVHGEHGDGGVNIVPCRFHSNVLLGSTAALPNRPVIVLRASSPGFQDRDNSKSVVKITNPEAENINMNQAFRGIDIEVGHNNSGATGLFFHGAQGGATQDVTVRMLSGFAGFGGGGGAGASHVNVKVIGGMVSQLWEQQLVV